MKQIFLTSSVDVVAHDIAKRVDWSRGKKLVFIDTPVKPKDIGAEWLLRDRQSLVDAGFEVVDYTITGKTIDQLRVDLAPFSFIYVCGGDTTYMLEQSLASGFFDLIKDLILHDGKTYISTSAGSIIAGPMVPDYLYDAKDIPEADERRGYGLVNFTIMPHWGSEDFRDKYLNKRLKIAYHDNQVPLLLLTDKQYVYIKDEEMKIIDVTKL